jgi:RNA polymerase sigma-70 factor (ECF subfamily)
MSIAEVTPLPTPLGPRDATLVAAARSGERWACEALFRRHAPRINRLAFRLLGRDADVDDVVQDAFVQALETLHKLKDDAAFGGWLSSMVVGRVAKVIRRRRLLHRLGLRRAEPIAVDDVIGRACPADTAAELRAIYGVLESMPTEVRITLILRRVEGSTIEEVAELMDASPATVKRRLSRAEELLQAFRGRDPS